MRKALVALVVLLGATALPAALNIVQPSIRVTEADGTPNAKVGTLRFSNGTVTISGSTATVTTGGGGGAGGGALNVGVGGSYTAVSSVQASGNLLFYIQDGTWIARVDLSSYTLLGGTQTLSGVNTFVGSTTLSNIIFVRSSSEVFTAGGSTGVIINPSGRIGIGTSTPAEELEIWGTNIPTLYITDPAGPVRFQAYSNNAFNASILGTKTNHSLVLAVNDVERMRIARAGGYIGIGTTAPGSRLHVSTAAGTDGPLADFSSGTANVFEVNLSSLVAGVAFYDGTGRRFIVSEDGFNLFIATFTPSAGGGSTPDGNLTNIATQSVNVGGYSLDNVSSMTMIGSSPSVITIPNGYISLNVVTSTFTIDTSSIEATGYDFFANSFQASSSLVLLNGPNVAGTIAASTGTNSWVTGSLTSDTVIMANSTNTRVVIGIGPNGSSVLISTNGMFVGSVTIAANGAQTPPGNGELLRVINGSVTITGTNYGFQVGATNFKVGSNNVGIGTLSPQAKLHVVGGSISVTGAGAGMIIGSSPVLTSVDVANAGALLGNATSFNFSTNLTPSLNAITRVLTLTAAGASGGEPGFLLFQTTGEPLIQKFNLYYSTAEQNLQGWILNQSSGELSDRGWNLFQATGPLAIQGWILNKSSGELSDQGWNLFQSTGPAAIQSWLLNLSSGELSDRGWNLFQATGPILINGWVLNQSTSELANRGWNLFQATGPAAIASWTLNLSTGELSDRGWNLFMATGNAKIEASSIFRSTAEGRIENSTDTYVGWMNQVAFSSTVISTPGTNGYGCILWSQTDSTGTDAVYEFRLASGAQTNDPQIYLTADSTGVNPNPIIFGVAIGTPAANGTDRLSVIWGSTQSVTLSSMTAGIGARMQQSAVVEFDGAGPQASNSRVIYVRIWPWTTGTSSQKIGRPPVLSWMRKTSFP